MKRIFVAVVLVGVTLVAAFALTPVKTTYAACGNGVEVDFVNGSSNCFTNTTIATVTNVVAIHDHLTGDLADFVDIGPNTGDYLLQNGTTDTWTTGQSGVLTITTLV